MLQGFEDYTAPLTEYERGTLLPWIADALSQRVGVKQAVSNKHICHILRERGYEGVSEPRVRKIINNIRIMGLVPRLVASSRGYYVTQDPDELDRYIESLAGREEAIRAVRLAMQAQKVILI